MIDRRIVVFLIMVLFLFGCSANRMIKNVSDTSVSINSLVTGEIKQSLVSVNDFMSNSLPTTIQKLQSVEESSLVTLSNLNKRVESIDSNSLMVLNNLNTSISNLNGNLPNTFSNLNTVVSSANITLTNLNKTVTDTDVVIINLQKSQQNLHENVSSWDFKLRMGSYIILGLLATYAFRKRNVIDDIKYLYNKLTVQS